MQKHCYNMEQELCAYLQAAHTTLPHSVSIINLIQHQRAPSKLKVIGRAFLKFLSLYVCADLNSSKKIKGLMISTCAFCQVMDDNN